MAADEFRYNASYWVLAYESQGGDAFIVPYMMGFGGNLVALAPNGLATFRFSDAHNYDVASMVRAAAESEPFPSQAD